MSGARILDVESGRLSLTLVSDGRFRNYPPDDGPARFGVVGRAREPAER